jgi:nucleoside-diphosphate-sugar epimerase
MGARRRVLLTGATRFVGRAFLERWADRYDFVVLARRAAPVALRGRAEWVKVDLREPLPLRRLPERVDAVVHLASLRAPSPGHGVEELFTVNAGAVAALFDYAQRAGARRFVLGSTGGVCGYHAAPIRESTAAAPFDAYTLSKWHGETVARHYERLGPIRVGIVRYFFPYGPGQESGIVTTLAKRITTGLPVLLHGGGRHPRLNPVFVDDACELTRRVLDAKASMTVNCAGPEVATVAQIATVIGDLCGLAPRFEPARAPGIGDMVARRREALRLLRYSPSTRLRQGLAATFTT